MINLLITGAVLLALAVGIAVIEIVFYRRRDRFEGEIFKYTRKRLVRRLSSAGVLAAISIMIVAGVAMADKFKNPAFFNIYWLVCFLLVLGCTWLYLRS